MASIPRDTLKMVKIQGEMDLPINIGILIYLLINKVYRKQNHDL